MPGTSLLRTDGVDDDPSARVRFFEPFVALAIFSGVDALAASASYSCAFFRLYTEL